VFIIIIISILFHKFSHGYIQWPWLQWLYHKLWVLSYYILVTYDRLSIILRVELSLISNLKHQSNKCVKKCTHKPQQQKWWSMTFHFTSVLWLSCMHRRTVWPKTLLIHFTKCMEICAPMMAVCDIGWCTWMMTTWTQWICLAVDNHELSPKSWSNHQRWLNSDEYRYCSIAFNFRHNAVQETWTLRHPTAESTTSWFPLANTWTQMDRYYSSFTVSRKTCWQGWQSLLNSVTGNESWVNYINP